MTTAAAMNITREEAAARAAALTVDAYEVSLDLTRGAEHFHTATTVTFAATQDAVGTHTWIDFVAGQAPTVTLNGEALDVADFDGARLRIGPLAAQNTLVVDGLGDYSNTGEGLHRFVDPVDQEVYLYTQFEVPDSRRMFAVFEQPEIPVVVGELCSIIATDITTGCEYGDCVQCRGNPKRIIDLPVHQLQ